MEINSFDVVKRMGDDGNMNLKLFTTVGAGRLNGNHGELTMITDRETVHSLLMNNPNLFVGLLVYPMKDYEQTRAAMEKELISANENSH